MLSCSAVLSCCAVLCCAQVLSLRQEKAKILGFDNFSQLSMASKVRLFVVGEGGWTAL
jgi:hypothetical protein